jgi:hypothetical protein
LLVLTLPGAAAPDALGAALMTAAGMCWASTRCSAVARARRSSKPPVISFARAS